MLVEVIEKSVDTARRVYKKEMSGTENGFVAWCVTQELRRSGYQITCKATGLRYPDDLGE